MSETTATSIPPSQFAFAILKPDAVKRNLVGSILREFELLGFSFAKIEMRTLTRLEAEDLYWEHKDKEHFRNLIDFTISGPVVILALVDSNTSIDSSPQTKHQQGAGRLKWHIGPASQALLQPWHLRAKFGATGRENLIHASENEECAVREVRIFWPDILYFRDCCYFE